MPSHVTQGFGGYQGARDMAGKQAWQTPTRRCTTEAGSSRTPSSRAKALGRIWGTDGTCRSFRLTAPRPGHANGRGQAPQDLLLVQDNYDCNR